MELGFARREAERHHNPFPSPHPRTPLPGPRLLGMFKMQPPGNPGRILALHANATDYRNQRLQQVQHMVHELGHPP